MSTIYSQSYANGDSGIKFSYFLDDSDYFVSIDARKFVGNPTLDEKGEQAVNCLSKSLRQELKDGAKIDGLSEDEKKQVNEEILRLVKHRFNLEPK